MTRTELKIVTDVKTLVTDEHYWLKEKDSQNVTLRKCFELAGRKYFANNIWAEEDNNQAMARWYIYGPVEMPTFTAPAIQWSGPETPVFATPTPPTPPTPPRLFNMMGGPKIPWYLAEIIYAGYCTPYATQTLERINERGGFDWAEVAHFFKNPDARKAMKDAEVKYYESLQ